MRPVVALTAVSVTVLVAHGLWRAARLAGEVIASTGYLRREGR